MTATNDLATVLTQLFATIEGRRESDPKKSYTAALLRAGPEKCAKKFGEEAIEAVIAGAKGDKQELTTEAADAFYHLLVLMAANEVKLDDIANELSNRTGQSGHAEKANRGA